MTTRIIILLCFTVGTACGQFAVPFAKSNRVVTIESWSHGEGKIWAVQDTQIVIYTENDYKTVKLLLSVPISIPQMQAIRNAISAIPRDAYGFHFAGEYSTSPPILTLHFTEDGAWERGRIEASGQMPIWAKPLLDTVSSACPPEWRVDFEAMASAYLLRLRDKENIPETLRNGLPEIIKFPIRDSEKEKKPWWKFWK